MSESDNQPYTLNIHVPGHDDARTDLVLDEFQEASIRRWWMFWGVVVFLVLDAVVFFVLLSWVFCLVAFRGGDWHLMGFAVIPGALLATIAIMAMRAVYNVSGKVGAQEISSLMQTIQNERGGDLSG